MISIALMTVREALRKKLIIVAFILAVIYLALYGTGLYFAGKELTKVTSGAINNQMMTSIMYAQLASMGLYLASFIMAFLAIFSAIGTISSEIETGTLHAVLPRPIRRRDIILGKFLGYSAVLAVFGAFIFVSITILNRTLLGFSLNNIPFALFLFILQSLLLLAVSVLGTTFLPTLGNGIAVFLLYSVALIGGFIEQIGAMVNSTKAINVGIVTSIIMPSDAVYRKIVNMVLPPSINILPQALGPFGAISTPSSWMIVWAITHMVLVVGLAIYVFGKRDI